MLSPSSLSPVSETGPCRPSSFESPLVMRFRGLERVHFFLLFIGQPVRGRLMLTKNHTPTISFCLCFTTCLVPDHGRDPLARGGQGPRAGGDRQPDALHRGIRWEEGCGHGPPAGAHALDHLSKSSYLALSFCCLFQNMLICCTDGIETWRYPAVVCFILRSFDVVRSLLGTALALSAGHSAGGGTRTVNQRALAKDDGTHADATWCSKQVKFSFSASSFLS